MTDLANLARPVGPAVERSLRGRALFDDDAALLGKFVVGWLHRCVFKPLLKPPVVCVYARGRLGRFVGAALPFTRMDSRPKRFIRRELERTRKFSHVMGGRHWWGPSWHDLWVFVEYESLIDARVSNGPISCVTIMN